ncbi:cysteine hydrolase [bacterium]|nr:cysteine hydrolase [bacterium]
MKIDKNLNEKYINIDPLKETYHESIVDNPERLQHEKRGDVALMCIDMQYLDAAQGYGIFADVLNSGVPIESQEYYFSTLKEVVLPNVRRLQDTFRSHGLEVIHVRIQSLTKHGRDRSKNHKNLNIHAAPGSKEAEFLPEIAPLENEIVINKTASGVFNSTNVHYVLSNMGIESLFVTGVYTNECVETTLRDASDRGYSVTVIEDGCTTVTKQLHEFSLATVKDRYARVMSTEAAIEEINEVAVPVLQQ